MQAVTFLEQARVRAMHEAVDKIMQKTAHATSYRERDHAENLYKKIVLQGITW